MSRLKNKKKVFIAMSGGVDSSVAALLLKNQGYDVTGVFIRCWSANRSDAFLGANCTVERDVEDARRVAAHLDIPFYVFDFEEEYKKKVVDYMIDGYRKGITPNPDVMCNKEIKFGLFLKKALELEADYVATGHYVRLCTSTNSESSKKILYSLIVAKDENKDQSYFLWTLTQEQLKHCLFPIGDYLKSEVREIARKAGLSVAEKKDSQGICFLGKVKLQDFLKNYIPEKKGEVVTTNGKKIGEHFGVYFYTIGQRHLKILNYESQASNSQPVYVVEKDMATNTLIVAEGKNNSALYTKEIKISDINFINPNFSSLIRANKEIEVLVRLRYRQPLTPVKIYQYKSDYQSSSASVVFKEPQKFVASGQSMVFYSTKNNINSVKGREMLGGGIII